MPYSVGNQGSWSKLKPHQSFSEPMSEFFEANSAAIETQQHWSPTCLSPSHVQKMNIDEPTPSAGACLGLQVCGRVSGTGKGTGPVKSCSLN